MTKDIVTLYYFTLCEIGVVVDSIDDVGQTTFSVPKFSELECFSEYRLPNNISVPAAAPIAIPLQGEFMMGLVSNIIKEMEGTPIGYIRDDVWTKEKAKAMREQLLPQEMLQEDADDDLSNFEL